MSIKSPCVKCDDQDNVNGFFTCNGGLFLREEDEKGLLIFFSGCGKHFCTNHISDHTDELRTRFDEISHEYNSVKEIFEECKRKFTDQHWKLIDEVSKALQKIKQQIDQCEKTSK